MPELPEVEHARRVLESHALGRIVRRLRALHPAIRRSLPPRTAARAVGHRVVRVERRAKHQYLHLDDGAALHVHFRMSGDWHIGRDDEPMLPHARAIIELDDGTRISLLDPRLVNVTDIPSLSSEPAGLSYDRESLGLRWWVVRPTCDQLANDAVVEADQHLSRVFSLHEAQPVPNSSVSTGSSTAALGTMETFAFRFTGSRAEIGVREQPLIG